MPRRDHLKTLWGHRKGPIPTLIQSIFDLLPDYTDPITERQLHDWLTGLESAIRLIYYVEQVEQYEESTGANT